MATVHYEKNYDNAFWDGTQLVFGDGDGKVFDRFTKPIDVLGHELSHAVTQHTANLIYEGQSGALNESLSDVFGACIKQRHLGQSAEDADWLVGAGIFLPGVSGKALRSMSRPEGGLRRPLLPAHRSGRWPTTSTTTAACTSRTAHPQPCVCHRSTRDRGREPGVGPAGSGTTHSPPGFDERQRLRRHLRSGRRSRSPVSARRSSEDAWTLGRSDRGSGPLHPAIPAQRDDTSGGRVARTGGIRPA